MQQFIPIAGNINTWPNIYYLEEKKSLSNQDPDPVDILSWP